MKTCDHQSVGVIITNERGEYLLLTRAKPPAGRAPVAGHVDEHGGEHEAALAEAREEVGIDLTEVGIDRTAYGQMTNICRRPPSHPTHDGHYWTIFEAQVDDTVQTRFDADETRGGQWVSQGPAAGTGRPHGELVHRRDLRPILQRRPWPGTGVGGLAGPHRSHRGRPQPARHGAGDLQRAAGLIRTTRDDQRGYEDPSVVPGLVQME